MLRGRIDGACSPSCPCRGRTRTSRRSRRSLTRRTRTEQDLGRPSSGSILLLVQFLLVTTTPSSGATALLLHRHHDALVARTAVKDCCGRRSNHHPFAAAPCLAFGSSSSSSSSFVGRSAAALRRHDHRRRRRRRPAGSPWVVRSSTTSTAVMMVPDVMMSSDDRHDQSQEPAITRSSRQQRGTGSGSTSKARPIDRKFWSENRFPAKEHCSLCGLCETSSYVGSVKEACPFLGDAMSRIDALEPIVHGRSRQGGGGGGVNQDGADADALLDLVWDDSPRTQQEKFDEGRFGVMVRPVELAKGIGMTPEAQWTGVVTSIAVSLLEAGLVDAVICVAAAAATKDETKGDHRKIPSPQPILARTPEQVLLGRGVKPVLAPCLSLLDEVENDPTIRNLLFCGVGCAVQALRSVQSQLGLENLYVMGTNCADNSPTAEAADAFVRVGVLGSDLPAESADAPTIRGYEFMPDFQVHVKTDREYVTKPYFSLAASMASSSIAPSCLACSDYTNALADVVVGYMGAPYSRSATDSSSNEGPQRMDQSWQTLTVRNDRGARMVEVASQAGRLNVQSFAQHFQSPSSHVKRRHQFERLVLSTVESDAIVKEMVGQAVPDAGLPEWLGNVMANVLTNWVAPTDVSFARYSIDYHLLRNYLHMVHAWGPDRADGSIPASARRIISHYKSKYSAFALLVERVERIYAARQ